MPDQPRYSLALLYWSNRSVPLGSGDVYLTYFMGRSYCEGVGLPESFS